MLVLALLALVAAPASAQMASPAKLQGVYERLCTGSGAASDATCTAMRRDMDAASKGRLETGPGWSGIVIEDIHYAIPAVVPGGPADRAGVRGGDTVIAVNGQPVTDTTAFNRMVADTAPGRRINLRLRRGGALLDLPVTLASEPTPNPKLNSQRTEPRVRPLWRSYPITFDSIRVGEAFDGIIETTDAGEGGARGDCIEVVGAGAARNLKAVLIPNAPDQARYGQQMRLYAMQDRCGLEGSSTGAASDPDAKTPFSLFFATQPVGKTFLMVMGRPSSKPYQLIVREQTSQDMEAWAAQKRERELAQRHADEARNRAAQDRAEMFGLLMQGAVAVGQGYAAGMQEANEANARSQAIIDQAAAADRRYFEAQRAAELAQRAGSQPTPQVRQAQAPEAPPTPRMPAPGDGLGATRPRAPATSQASLISRTTRAYFTTGIAPTAKNTRNPLCYSTPFSITFQHKPQEGYGEIAQAAAAAHVQTFLAKCAQFGRLDPGPPPRANIEGFTSGWPYPSLHAEDRQVRVP
ncbi:MAG: PDZ domain-containing protein [Phenylobacterium sp.]|uniref:S1C family serine protease n=1 Tax=Phenylobacterium sp. TaxID=1871053 RepID=UPI001B6270D0|nr:PDZ domain-containing protein [Phenylobacterium sp.]MBP7816295.1 PDZ domain-containing protein [Phenylobacterium sp.]MBP9232302.1 PDZ domain-containing protein [Phenylobacterium sp.]MBP9754649.1 PDZ domain-containing protein [Phenylobacterium sp.]